MPEARYSRTFDFKIEVTHREPLDDMSRGQAFELLLRKLLIAAMPGLKEKMPDGMTVAAVDDWPDFENWDTE